MEVLIHLVMPDGKRVTLEQVEMSYIPRVNDVLRLIAPNEKEVCNYVVTNVLYELPRDGVKHPRIHTGYVHRQTEITALRSSTEY